ncbi:MAG: fatty acid desaturase [Pseudomonadota bacterium]
MSKVTKRSDLKSFIVIVANIAFVFAPIYLAALSGLSPLLLVYWLWFGLSMQGLLNLLHETAHLHVFRARRANEFLGRWVLGPLMFSDFDRYREIHWAHHRNIGQHGDPKYSYKIDIRGSRSLAFIFRSLVLIEAIRKLRYVHGDAKPKVKTNGGRSWIMRTTIVQSAFIGSLCLIPHGDLGHVLLGVVCAYGFVYFYGILSLTVMAANLRAIAEHQLGDSQLEVAGVAALRNLASTPVTWLIFGSYGFAEHAAHHRSPSIPYYLLRTEALEMTGPSLGYFEVLSKIVGSRVDNQSIRPARRMLMF